MSSGLRKKIMAFTNKKRDESSPSRKARLNAREIIFPQSVQLDRRAAQLALKQAIPTTVSKPVPSAPTESPRAINARNSLVMKDDPPCMDAVCHDAEDAFRGFMQRLSQRAEPSIRLSVAIDQAIEFGDEKENPAIAADNCKGAAPEVNPRYSRMVSPGVLADLNVRGLEECRKVDELMPQVSVKAASAPTKASLPPMYVDVDPATHYSEFVPVGKGASGAVFFAKNNETSDTVALKRVTPSTRSKTKALENEIRTMHALQHPNIIRCHEAYSHNGSVWIVMEAMDVGCLTHVLDFLRTKGYLLDEAHIAYILLEALQGLWAMHSRSKVHRDIKSDNILVNSCGEVKLADFEYTAQLTEETPKRRTVVGTAWWMAPETVRASYYDYGADVWSIGILAIECAEWVPPLFGMECSRALETIKAGDLTQGFKRPDMWSAEFADFVHGCLTRDRTLRYSVPQLLKHPFLKKACSQVQMANVFRACRGLDPIAL